MSIQVFFFVKFVAFQKFLRNFAPANPSKKAMIHNFFRHILFCICLFIGLNAFAYDAYIGGIYYNFSGNNATVTYKNNNFNSYSGSVVIPSVVTYNSKTYSVISIGSQAFYSCSRLTSITIPESLTSIGTWAFRDCRSLTSITIPSGVTSIGERAFYSCSGLTSVTIGNSVTGIGKYAFYGCSGLTSVTIPNSVTSIGDYAFSDCNSLTSFTIPNSVTSIGDYAFSGCSSLTSITIPNSMTYIGNNTFDGCTGLSSVTIPESVTSIDYDAFLGCSNLISITIPNSVTYIGSDTFSGCSSLTSIIIGNSVTYIGNNAFSGTNLKKTIWLTNTPPSGYTNAKGSINYVSNEQYTSLQNTVVYPFLSSMFEVEGIKYVPVNPSERTCDAIDCVYGKSASNLNIPSTVSYRGISMNVHDVKPYFCYNNNFIDTLSCENAGNISEYAFDSCTGITSAVCNNTGNIAEYAFSSCTGITSAICNNTGNIARNAFYGCTNMTSLLLGEDVSAIGDYAFHYCSSLQSVNIPDATTSLGAYAFERCTRMTSAKIGAGIKAIPTYAFSDCSSLTDIQIGKNVQSIGTYAFSGCSALPTIAIPKSVNTIDDCAFQSCTALKNFIIDDRENELSLGDCWDSPLFYYCPLDSVYIGGNITYDTSSSKGYSPFYRNTTLRTVVITDRETEISPYEFYGCTNLQNFKIGDGVTSFGDWAFSGCTSLKSLTFGTQLQSIGKEAFSDCASVTQIVSKAATPPLCSDQALDDINKWDCTLFVPEGSLSAYQGAEQWKQFFFIVEGTGSGVEPEPEGFRNDKLYTLTCKRGGLVMNSDGTGLAAGQIRTDETEADKCFAIITYEGAQYLYSPVNKQYLLFDGSFVSRLGSPITFDDSHADGDYKFMISTQNEKGETLYFNNNGTFSVTGIEICGWDTPDDGNRWLIEPVADFDPTEALALASSQTFTVTYNVTFDSNVVATATEEVGSGSALPPPPASLSNKFITLTETGTHPTTVTEEVTVTYNATWKGPFEFTKTVGNAKWYNMHIRSGNYVGKQDTEPYYPAQVDETTLATPAYQWAFGGDPYHVKVYNRTTGLNETLTKDGENAVMHSGDYTWDLLPNTDGFVLRVTGTEYSCINQLGGDTGPLQFWTDNRSLTDNSSTFCVVESDSYTLTYIVDGEVYQSFTIMYRESILPLEPPTKEGYTFSGWSEIPATMPDHDVVVHGNFYLYGDVNGDDVVDLSDAIMVTYYSLHQIPAKFNEAVADMNDDGEIDLSDAIIIIYKSLGVK